VGRNRYLGRGHGLAHRGLQSEEKESAGAGQAQGESMVLVGGGQRIQNGTSCLELLRDVVGNPSGSEVVN
jgi:hypothetical protein